MICYGGLVDWLIRYPMTAVVTVVFTSCPTTVCNWTTAEPVYTPSRPVQKNDNRLVLSKLPFKLWIVMPILVPVDFVYKHGSSCSTCMIKRTLRFWFGSNCVPGISFAYLYAYSKKSLGYFNCLIGYLRKYAAYLELCCSD